MSESDRRGMRPDRRGFLIRGGSLLLLLPVGWAAAGCSGEDGNTQIVMNGAIVFLSSATNGHNHTFTLEVQDLLQPPSAGLSGDTSSAQDHVHVVSLTQEELSLIQANQTVIKNTSITDGHMHSFQFMNSVQ